MTPCALDPAHGRIGNRNRDYPHVEAVLSVFLYTGGRSEEVLGLRVEDIDFDARRVHFRPNSFRKLKRWWCRRSVELWPALADVLRAYLDRTGLKTGLLFPSGKGVPMHSFNKQLERACRRADLAAQRSIELARPLSGRISPHSLRHTHASVLLNTTVCTESGMRAVRSTHSVARALGHRKSSLVETTYGHLFSEALLTDTLSFEPWRQKPATRLRGAAPEAPGSSTAPDAEAARG